MGDWTLAIVGVLGATGAWLVVWSTMRGHFEMERQKATREGYLNGWEAGKVEGFKEGQLSPRRDARGHFISAKISKEIEKEVGNVQNRG